MVTSTEFTEPLISWLRYLWTGLFQIFNDLPHEETLETSESYPLTQLPNPASQPRASGSIDSERLLIKITINHVRRILSILILGFGGGWSCLPDEKRAPTSITWVIFLVVLTDW